ncbi:hypothetical protein BAY59_24345 [Prauserella coralliicola]|nr:hypothetical protein BAY59_24345 [Prauserella coralliicola]
MLGARINTEFGLCPTCTRHVERAIAELPRDYVELSLQLGKTGSPVGDKVSGSRDTPTPIRLGVEATMRAIAHEAQVWAESVGEVLNTAWDTQTARDSRPGAVLQRACTLLAGSVSALLALRGVDHLVGDDRDGYVPVTRDGVDGALVLADLHQRARFILGKTRIVHRLPAPCPRCESTALERPDGSDTITCSACLRVYSWDEYQRLCCALADRREIADAA